MRKPLVLIKGGGDLASGAAHALAVRGIAVVVTELRKPTMVRRKVSFGNAVYEGDVEIEGVKGVLCPSAKEAFIAVHSGDVAVVVDPVCSGIQFLKPHVLLDARMAKRNTGTRAHDAPVVIALGPGFTAGVDCHAVIETLRGPGLGAVLYTGSAAPSTGRPAEVMGHAADRVLRAPCDGVFEGSLSIGDMVRAGVTVGRVRPASGPREEASKGLPADVRAEIAGVLRGVLADGVAVREGQKVGDVDPSGRRETCLVLSDKALRVGDGVLEAIRKLAPQVLENAWPAGGAAAKLQGRGIEPLRRRWPWAVGGS
jgi:xanthine dehydrogenase accessory factor